MIKKVILSILIFSLLIITACSQTSVAPVKESAGIDIIRQAVKTIEVIEKVVEQPEEVEEMPEEEQKNDEISSEVTELLNLANQQIQSIKYSYKGSETRNFFYTFYIRGDRIKYVLDPAYRVIDVDDDAYDTIYINKESRTALAYCDSKKCKVRGKKAVLDYDEAYIFTPFDWIDEVEYPQKIDEYLVDRRNTMMLTTEDFTIWIDTIFGVPLKVETADNLYRFQRMIINTLKDEDVLSKR